MNGTVLSTQFPTDVNIIIYILVNLFLFSLIGFLSGVLIFILTRYIFNYETIDRITDTINEKYNRRFSKIDRSFVILCHISLSLFFAVTSYLLPEQTRLVVIALAIIPVIYTILLFITLVSILPRVGYKWYDVVPKKQEYKEVAVWCFGTTAINLVFVLTSFLIIGLLAAQTI